MKHLALLALILICTGCSTLPQLYQAAEDIANDEAIEVMVSREAIQKQTDVTVTVDVKNNPAAAK